MLPSIKIPSGYRFTFFSVESHGNHERTIVREGLSEVEANLFSELANVIKSKSTGLENQSNLTEEQLEKAFQVLWPIFEKYDQIFDYEDLDMFMGDLGLMVDYINDYILGYPSGNCWLRQLEDYEVQYTPENINLENVTSKFKK
jgi:hypothetical protein